MLKRLLPGLAVLATAAPEATGRAASSSAPRTLMSVKERDSLKKFYKQLGMKPPQPRRMSPEAARVRSE